MSRKTDTSDSLPVSPISLVKAVQSGQIGAKSLPKEHRQTCVEYLTNEGYSSGEISEILKVSPRTIRRDRERIRQDNAVILDADFTGRHIGLLVQRSQHAVENLTRLFKEKNCPANVRADAIQKTWTITKELSQMLQSIGYLPNAALNVRTDFNHNICEPPGFEQLISEVETLERSLEQSNVCDEKAVEMITELKSLLSRSSFSSIIKHIQTNIMEIKEND